jgi:hypothetical protein
MRISGKAAFRAGQVIANERDDANIGQHSIALGEGVLAKIAAMAIREWNYKSQDDTIRHLGPSAQDFHEAFGLGESDTTITTTDIDGINLLASQALERRTAALDRENRALRSELAVLRSDLEALRRAMASIQATHPGRR